MTGCDGAKKKRGLRSELARVGSEATSTQSNVLPNHFW